MLWCQKFRNNWEKFFFLIRVSKRVEHRWIILICSDSLKNTRTQIPNSNAQPCRIVTRIHTLCIYMYVCIFIYMYICIGNVYYVRFSRHTICFKQLAPQVARATKTRMLADERITDIMWLCRRFTISVFEISYTFVFYNELKLLGFIIASIRSCCMAENVRFDSANIAAIDRQVVRGAPDHRPALAATTNHLPLIAVQSQLLSLLPRPAT